MEANWVTTGNWIDGLSNLDHLPKIVRNEDGEGWFIYALQYACDPARPKVPVLVDRPMPTRTYGPRWAKGIKDKVDTEGKRFIMADDDGNVYFEGRVLEGHEEEPLEMQGRAYGCTHLLIEVAHPVYESCIG